MRSILIWKAAVFIAIRSELITIPFSQFVIPSEKEKGIRLVRRNFLISLLGIIEGDGRTGRQTKGMSVLDIVSTLYHLSALMKLKVGHTCRMSGPHLVQLATSSQR